MRSLLIWHLSVSIINAQTSDDLSVSVDVTGVVEVLWTGTDHR